MNIRLIGLFVLFSILSISRSAYATYPDISGTYSGNFNYSETSCATIPDANDIFSVNLSVQKTGETQFSGSGTLSEGGESDSLDVTINLTSETTFNFTWQEANLTDPDEFAANGTGTGTISGSSLSFDGSGSETTSESCLIDFDGTLTRTSGTVIASAASPSSSVTEAVLFNRQVQGTVTGISNRVAGAVGAMRTSLRPRFSDNEFKLEGQTGLNAGDGMGMPIGVWGNYSYTNYENDLSSTSFDGSSNGFLGGVDFNVWEGTVLGVAVGYENGDIDTNFNGGNQDTDTFTVAPYFGAILDDTLSLDFNIGYSRVEYDQFRTAGATRVSSAPRADRWFGAFNLNAITFVDQWILSGRAGMLYATSTIDSYTESNGTVVADSRSRVGTASIAGEAAYMWGDFEPFLNLAYQYDFQLQKISAAAGPQPSNDTDDILLSTGVRYFEQSGISGNLEYSKRLLRDDFDEDRISLTVRVDY